MTTSAATHSTADRALEALRLAGNPFRNYFARNPDDEVCARYHVAELYAAEREQLLGVVDLYRYAASMHSEVVPVLGNKGAGKTHLLHSIKHGGDSGWQLLVTPGTYHKDTDFLEYLLFQVIDTLLSGGTQRGARPLNYVADLQTRRLLAEALEAMSPAERLLLFPLTGLGRWARKLGLGAAQAQERVQWLVESLGRAAPAGTAPTVRALCDDAGLSAESASSLACGHADRADSHDAGGLMRRHIRRGLVRCALDGDESELAAFLTNGFAELEYHVRPTRQDLVLALFKAVMGVLRGLHIPVVVAFDQLEDLLLVRRTEDGRRAAEAFFAGVVQAIHQLDGLCFLVFAERGLWNRFVPSLDGYIQDRLNNPIHLPNHGTLTTVLLEPPAPELVRRIVEARLRPTLEDVPEFTELSPVFPFDDDQVMRVARSEATLRDMLQQFRRLFDHVVYPSGGAAPAGSPNRIGSPEPPATVKSVVVVETPVDGAGHSVKVLEDRGGARLLGGDLRPDDNANRAKSTEEVLAELWDHEVHTARAQLEPEGALPGATRELQAGLGQFLQVCHEQGVKVGPWRLNHVTPEVTFGEHPTYGVLTLAQWVCRDGQPWRVGLGLFLGRGPGKPKDLQTKLAVLEAQPAPVDYLVLLRPADDVALTGKSKALWQEAEGRGRHARIEPISAEGLAVLYGFGRWLTAASDAQAPGQSLPNLAEFLQERCEPLLQQLCMPVQA